MVKPNQRTKIWTKEILLSFKFLFLLLYLELICVWKNAKQQKPNSKSSLYILIPRKSA